MPSNPVSMVIYSTTGAPVVVPVYSSVVPYYYMVDFKTIFSTMFYLLLGHSNYKVRVRLKLGVLRLDMHPDASLCRVLKCLCHHVHFRGSPPLGCHQHKNSKYD